MRQKAWLLKGVVPCFQWNVDVLYAFSFRHCIAPTSNKVACFKVIAKSYSLLLTPVGNPDWLCFSCNTINKMCPPQRSSGLCLHIRILTPSFCLHYFVILMNATYLSAFQNSMHSLGTDAHCLEISVLSAPLLAPRLRNVEQSSENRISINPSLYGEVKCTLRVVLASRRQRPLLQPQQNNQLFGYLVI
jgi:hypothetical protein